jgi:predicted permease
MCTNQGSFGGLLAFFILGDQGYFYLQLFIILEIVLYFILGFPVSSDISKGSTRLLNFNSKTLTEKPLSLIPIVAVLAGILLNSAHIYHPSYMDSVAAFFIPATTAANCLAIGMTLQLGAIKDYYKEISLVFIAKYFVNPVIVLPLAYLLVIKGVITLLAFKVLVILVFMPVGFTALLAPVLYNFDLDVANSIWITTTLTSLFVFIPILYLILA